MLLQLHMVSIKKNILKYHKFTQLCSFKDNLENLPELVILKNAANRIEECTVIH